MSQPREATDDFSQHERCAIATWYNTRHRHSAIRFVTPDQRHRGEDRGLLDSRNQVYEMARAARPERWSGQTRNWKPIGPVWLKPERPDAGHGGPGSAEALNQEADGAGTMTVPAKRVAQNETRRQQL